MNKDILERKWNQLSGCMQENWSVLNDADIDQIIGKFDILHGKLQEN